MGQPVGEDLKVSPEQNDVVVVGPNNPDYHKDAAIMFLGSEKEGFARALLNGELPIGDDVESFGRIAKTTELAFGWELVDQESIVTVKDQAGADLQLNGKPVEYGIAYAGGNDLSGTPLETNVLGVKQTIIEDGQQVEKVIPYFLPKGDIQKVEMTQVEVEGKTQNVYKVHYNNLNEEQGKDGILSLAVLEYNPTGEEVTEYFPDPSNSLYLDKKYLGIIPAVFTENEPPKGVLSNVEIPFVEKPISVFVNESGDLIVGFEAEGGSALLPGNQINLGNRIPLGDIFQGTAGTGESLPTGDILNSVVSATDLWDYTKDNDGNINGIKQYPAVMIRSYNPDTLEIETTVIPLSQEVGGNVVLNEANVIHWKDGSAPVKEGTEFAMSGDLFKGEHRLFMERLSSRHQVEGEAPVYTVVMAKPGKLSLFLFHPASEIKGAGMDGVTIELKNPDGQYAVVGTDNDGNPTYLTVEEIEANVHYKVTGFNNPEGKDLTVEYGVVNANPNGEEWPTLSYYSTAGIVAESFKIFLPVVTKAEALLGAFVGGFLWLTRRKNLNLLANAVRNGGDIDALAEKYSVRREDIERFM